MFRIRIRIIEVLLDLDLGGDYLRNKTSIITKKTKTKLGLGQTVQSPLSPPPPHRLYHPPPTNTRQPGSTDDLSLSLTQPHVC